MRKLALCIDLPSSVTDVKKYVKGRIGFEIAGIKQIELEARFSDFGKSKRQFMFNNGDFNRYDIQFKINNPTRTIDREFFETRLSQCNVVYYLHR
jgi:hypothetical protein